MLGGRSVDDELLEDLEGLLFTADLGVQTAESLMESVRSKAKGQDASAIVSLRSGGSVWSLVVLQDGSVGAGTGSSGVLLFSASAVAGAAPSPGRWSRPRRWNRLQSAAAGIRDTRDR